MVPRDALHSLVSSGLGKVDEAYYIKDIEANFLDGSTFPDWLREEGEKIGVFTKAKSGRQYVIDKVLAEVKWAFKTFCCESTAHNNKNRIRASTTNNETHGEMKPNLASMV